MVVTMMGSTAEKLHAANATRLDLVGNGFGFAGSGLCCGFGGFFGIVNVRIDFVKNAAKDRLTFGVRGVRGGGNNFDRCYGWL